MSFFVITNIIYGKFIMRLDFNLIKKIISFTFWGILTTLLNIALYYLFRYFKISVQLSTIFAWFLCVLFAFITNKKYVFKNRSTSIDAFIREIVYFYGSRLFSGIADVLIMSLFVDILSLNEIFSKITDEILVSAFNFLFSFLVIFKEKRVLPENNAEGGVDE